MRAFVGSSPGSSLCLFVVVTHLQFGFGSIWVLYLFSFIYEAWKLVYIQGFEFLIGDCIDFVICSLIVLNRYL